MKNFLFTMFGVSVIMLSCSKKETSYQNSGIDSSASDNATGYNQNNTDSVSVKTDTMKTRIDSVQTR